MLPATPVLDGYREVVIAKDQPEYIPLPAVIRHGIVTSRWKMTWRERIVALLTGNVYLQVMTFNRPLQPVILSVDKPQMEHETVQSIDGIPA